MIIRLASVQIAQFWDTIKYTLQQVERIGTDQSEAQFNEVFAVLLNDKAQCFMKYDEDGAVQGVMITEVMENKVTRQRTLKIRSLFVFKAFDMREWVVDFPIITNLARAEKCDKIIFETGNPRVVEIARSVGFTKSFVTMEYPIGG